MQLLVRSQGSLPLLVRCFLAEGISIPCKVISPTTAGVQRGRWARPYAFVKGLQYLRRQLSKNTKSVGLDPGVKCCPPFPLVDRTTAKIVPTQPKNTVQTMKRVGFAESHMSCRIDWLSSIRLSLSGRRHLTRRPTRGSGGVPD